MDDMHRDAVESESSEIQCDVTEKRSRKFTLKGISMMIERLQKERKCNFLQAGKLKTKITTLVASKENVSVVQQNLKRFKGLWQIASELHNTLLPELPLQGEEQRKQEAFFFFFSKKAANYIFIEEISTWLKGNGISLDDDQNAKSKCQDDIDPGDSVSNVSSRKGQGRSSVCSISSACIDVYSLRETRMTRLQDHVPKYDELSGEASQNLVSSTFWRYFRCTTKHLK